MLRQLSDTRDPVRVLPAVCEGVPDTAGSAGDAEPGGARHGQLSGVAPRQVGG